MKGNYEVNDIYFKESKLSKPESLLQALIHSYSTPSDEACVTKESDNFAASKSLAMEILATVMTPDEKYHIARSDIGTSVICLIPAQYRLSQKMYKTVYSEFFKNTRQSRSYIGSYRYLTNEEMAAGAYRHLLSKISRLKEQCKPCTSNLAPTLQDNEEIGSGSQLSGESSLQKRSFTEMLTSTLEPIECMVKSEDTDGISSVFSPTLSNLKKRVKQHWEQYEIIVQPPFCFIHLRVPGKMVKLMEIDFQLMESEIIIKLEVQSHGWKEPSFYMVRFYKNITL
jgi:hypothetical protein